MENNQRNVGARRRIGRHKSLAHKQRDLHTHRVTFTIILRHFSIWLVYFSKIFPFIVIIPLPIYFSKTFPFIVRIPYQLLFFKHFYSHSSLLLLLTLFVIHQTATCTVFDRTLKCKIGKVV